MNIIKKILCKKLKKKSTDLIKKIAKLDNQIRKKGIEIEQYQKRVKKLEDYIRELNNKA